MNKMEHHSWYDSHAHVFRSDGRVVRATIKESVINDGGLMLKVLFIDKGVLKRKYVSPITIATLQVLWINVDVVSDIETEDSVHDNDTFIPPMECDYLAKLSISGIQSDSTRAIISVVNTILQVTHGSTDPSTLRRKSKGTKIAKRGHKYEATPVRRCRHARG